MTSLLNYRVEMNPYAPKITVRIADITTTEMKAKVVDMENVTFQIRVAENQHGVTKAFSAMAAPVAVILADLAGRQGKVKEYVKKVAVPIKFGKPLGYKFTVQGQDINAKPKDIKVETHQGMLLASASDLSFE